MSFVESISIGTTIAENRGYYLHPSQELVALGTANIVGSFFSCYSTTGSFSRTATNDFVGAVSQFSCVFCVVIVLLTLKFLTGVLYYLPQVVLSSIVLMAAYSITDFTRVPDIWRRNKPELFVWFAAFFAPLGLGVEIGILIAIGVALIFVLYPIALPKTSFMGKLPGVNTYRSVERFPNVLIHPSIHIVRISSSLCFLNVSFIKKFMREIVTKSHKKVLVVIMDWSPVCDIDLSATDTLKESIDKLNAKGIIFLHCRVKGFISDKLKRFGFFRSIRYEHFFWELHDASLYASQLVREARDRKQEESRRASEEVNREGEEKVIETRFESNKTNLDRLNLDDEADLMDEELVEYNQASDDYSPLLYADDEVKDESIWPDFLRNFFYC